MADNGTAASSSHSKVRANASVRSRALGSIPATLGALNSLRTDERKAAVAEAVRSFDEGLIVRPQETGWVNVLARSFFSYSHDSFSPSRLAWEAVIRGLSVIGCADIDNLGALNEMYSAGDAFGIRAAVSMETVTYADGCAEQELNCPARPGLLRALGVGFAKVPPLNSDAGRFIASLPAQARERNLRLVAKLNPLLTPVAVDYVADVLPVTPAGNANPEHIAVAYINKARETFPAVEDQAVFWADVLGRSPNEAEALFADAGLFLDAVLEKMAALVPETPNPTRYPAVTEFFEAVEASGALACVLVRDGRSDGEADPERLLDFAIQWGARAVALTPDAFWNVADACEKEARLSALAAIVAAARRRHLPVLAGSFMGGARQKFVDSFDAPELAPYFRDFTDSAFWLYGHATMERALGLGLAGEWAEHRFGPDREAANAFYIEVGKKAAPGKATRARLAAAGTEPKPGDVFDALAPLRI